MIKKIAVSFLFAFVFLLSANQALGAENYCTPFSGGIYTDEHPEGSWNHCEGDNLIKYSCVGTEGDWKTNSPINCLSTFPKFGFCNGNTCAKHECLTSSDCGTGEYCYTKTAPYTCEDGCSGTPPSNADACSNPSNFATLVGLSGKYPIKLSTNNTCPSAPCYYKCEYPTYVYESGKCILNAPSLEAGECNINNRISINIWKDYSDAYRFKLIPIMDGVELNAITVGKNYIYQGKPGKSYSFKAYEIDDAGNKVGATSYSCKNCPSICAPNYDGSGNTKPVATITVPGANQTISANSSITFTGTGNDEDSGDTITGYEWRTGSCDGTLLDAGSVVPNTQTITFPVTKTIFFKVKDVHNVWSLCDSRTIAVAVPGDPTLNFYPENNIYTIPSGTSTTLYWTTTNVSSCTATGDWTTLGSKVINGSEPTGNLTASKTYTLECFKGSTGFNNSSGSAAVKQSVTIGVSSCVPLCNDATICQGVPYLDAICGTPCMGNRNCCTDDCSVGRANTCIGQNYINKCDGSDCGSGTKDCSWREVAP